MPRQSRKLQKMAEKNTCKANRRASGYGAVNDKQAAVSPNFRTGTAKSQEQKQKKRASVSCGRQKAALSKSLKI
jgi:hypothetical protein